MSRARGTDGSLLASLPWTLVALGFAIVPHLPFLPIWITATLVACALWRYSIEVRRKRTITRPVTPEAGEQAEAEGLDKIFKAAGAQWRYAGCSMCLGMNPDQLKPQQRCASTSNRNFEGRQGSGARTMLASPETAAACAVLGYVGSVFDLEKGRLN